MLTATYMSSDEVERADAFRVDYVTVCQHPNEIGELEASDLLVLDMNNVLFEDDRLAVQKANEAALRGVLVGVHTYNPDRLKSLGLIKRSNVVVAKNHVRLLFHLGRHAKLHGRPWQKIVKAAKLLKGQVTHVHKHHQEGTASVEADVPAGA